MVHNLLEINNLINIHHVVEIDVKRQEEHRDIKWVEHVGNLFTPVKRGWYYSILGEGSWIDEEEVSNISKHVYLDHDLRKAFYYPHIEFGMVDRSRCYRWFETVDELNAYLKDMELSMFV
jgi:hypothetical protein